MKRLVFCILISHLFSGVVFSQPAIKVEKFVLDNGLTVFLHEDHNLPQVFGAVITRAGGKNDPEDATGMAHYQEHMLFKGTEKLGTIDWEKEKTHIDKIFELYDQLGKTTDEEKRKDIQKQINEESLKASEYAIPNELSNLIKSIGGTRLNAGTGPDNTIFYNAFPPNQIEKWLELYSHRFMNPVFRSFQAELEVVYEEKNMYADMFVMSLIEKFNEKFFKKHPYGQQTLIGTIDDLKNPSLTKMYEFFKTYYVANNMALVLCGDFDTQQVKSMVREKFGKWRSAELPEKKIYEEVPFNGRELVVEKLSPIKLGLLGFRTAPAGHPDEIALDICNGILSNASQTGLLDKLTIDNKLLAAQILPMQYHDQGATIIIVIPKILGQKMDDAEQLVMTELDKLRKGNFDDWMVEAIKNQLYKQFAMSLESIENKAVLIADIFSRGQDVDDYLTYPEKVRKITKDDVVKAANKYYSDNYLAFHSKMGFPKKEKIDKPGYEPLIANTNAKSEFAKYFESIPSQEPLEKFIDFDNDISGKEIKEKVSLYCTKNVLNDIFTLKIKYGIGDFKDPLLKSASEIMNFSGAGDLKVTELKNEFSKIGCSYTILSDESYVTISVDGLEENLADAVKLLDKLITKPMLDSEKLEILVNGEKTNRKMERSEPDNVADALFEYVLYKERSEYIDRMSIKEIKKLVADSLVKAFMDATRYEMEIHYAGKYDIDKVGGILTDELTIRDDLIKSDSPVEMEKEVYKDNIVYFVNKKKALQSKVFFFTNGDTYNKEQEPYMDAFNMYFGGGFSGIVLQEIREYRSMAYSAGASYKKPVKSGNKCGFTGYVGTQADKTNEALEVFYDLIRNMPEKSERMEMIRRFLVQSALTDKPGFRDLSRKIKSMELLGYDEDPAISKVEVYKNLEFDDIVEFYKKNLKDRPIVISIVGDKKRIDMEKLKKFGKIIEIKEKDLFTK